MSTETTTVCLLCGHAADLKDSERPGYQSPDKFRIYECTSCNTSFSLPRVDAIKIYENIYKNGSKVPGYDRYWKYLEGVKKAKNPLEYLAENEDIYWSVKEAINVIVHDKGNSKILEIGSGLGYLTYALHRAGYSIEGLDISKTAVQMAVENFGDYYICADLFEFANQHAESYDVVVLTEVIEHIDTPSDFVKSIVKLLKPTGKIIMTTPNKSLFESDIIWKTENPPVHFWWFSEDSMRFIARQNQMELNFTDFSGFYKRNYTSYNLRKIRAALPLNPTFDDNGNLYANNKKRNFLREQARLLLSELPATKKVLNNIRSYMRKLKEASNHDIIVCDSRGTVLCAIFEKGSTDNLSIKN